MRRYVTAGSGEVRPGRDSVVSHGEFRPVLHVRVHPPGAIPEEGPIRSDRPDLLAIEIVTDVGSRWFGVKEVVIRECGSVYWSGI